MKRLKLVLGLIAFLICAQVAVVSAQMMGMGGEDMMEHGKMMGNPEGMKMCPMCMMRQQAGMMKKCPMCKQMGKDEQDKGLDDIFEQKMKSIWMNADELGITDEQMKSIKDLKTMVKKDLVMKEAQIEIMVIDLKAMLMDDPLDVNAVNALLDKKYEAKKDMAKMLVTAISDLKKILTADQKAKMKGMTRKGKKGSNY